jgi:hypothetical protein
MEPGLPGPTLTAIHTPAWSPPLIFSIIFLSVYIIPIIAPCLRGFLFRFSVSLKLPPLFGLSASELDSYCFSYSDTAFVSLLARR